MSFDSGNQLQVLDEIHVGSIISKQREDKGYATRGEICKRAEILEIEAPEHFKAFSPSSLWGWENDATGLRIARANNKTLRTLSYLLGWGETEFIKRMKFSIEPVPRLDHHAQGHIFSFVERYGVRFKASVRLPIYGSVAAGIEGFESAEEPDGYEVFDDEEVPRGVDPKKLYLVRANGTSMYEENLPKAIPDGSKLMVHHRAAPVNNQVVVAYIPERDIGVVKQYREGHDGKGVLLKSFQMGGPSFMASDYPSMYVSGVVRRVVFDL